MNMPEKILLYVVSGPGGDAAARWALALARQTGSRVFAVHVIGPEAGESDSGSSADAIEEEAWKILYEVEDDAFELDVKLSLVLEQGDPVARFVELGASYACDLLVVPTGIFRSDDLVALSPVPIVFVRGGQETARPGVSKEEK